MKSLLTGFALAFFATSATAQAPVFASNPAGKSELVFVSQAPSNQDALFSKAKDWVFRTYNSGKAVTQFEDRAAGHLLVKARTASMIRPESGMNDGSFTYTLSIDLKDGKARFAVTDIYYEAGGTSRSLLVSSGANLADPYPANWPTVRKKGFMERWGKMQALAQADLTALAESFQAALLAKASDF